jgi:hypothetical protein
METIDYQIVKLWNRISYVYDTENKWLVWSQHRNTNGGIGQSRWYYQMMLYIITEIIGQ